MRFQWCFVALCVLVSGLPLFAAEDAVQPVLMSGDWVSEACEAWNQEPSLTGGLSNWMQNDAERGYKFIRIYRRDCPESYRIELKLSAVDEETRCVASGMASDEALNPKTDYVMYADTDRWVEMGEGKYGPMGGMMTGRLKFEGPKWEAMKNMGPFKSFLLLVGKVPSTRESCPGDDAAVPMDEAVEEGVPVEEGESETVEPASAGDG